MKGPKAKVNTSYHVPYGAGVSSDSRTIYIDKRIPQFLRLDGRKLNVWHYLELHETVEFALMHHMHMDYKNAHELATNLEHDAVYQDGFNSGAYEKALHPILAECEQEFSSVPPDLDTRPYRDTRDVKTLDKLLKLQKGEKK